jgi:outer membrane protein assembly factor BamD (BamD/ComL family)
LKPTTAIVALLVTGGLMLSCSSGSSGKKTEQELYTLAQESSEKGDFQSAIRTYQDILKDYPDSPRAYKAQFLIAFVYSENLKDYENARLNYQMVIDKYPDSDLADDARYMLQNLEQEATPTIPDAGDSREDDQ